MHNQNKILNDIKNELIDINSDYENNEIIYDMITNLKMINEDLPNTDDISQNIFMINNIKISVIYHFNLETFYNINFYIHDIHCDVTNKTELRKICDNDEDLMDFIEILFVYYYRRINDDIN